VDNTAGLDGVEKRKILPLTGIELWPSSCSSSIYRLSYRSSTGALGLQSLSLQTLREYITCEIVRADEKRGGTR
jgi:hypothetical protein